MPELSTPPALASCARWPLSTSQACLPWWKAAIGGGSGVCSWNKLEWRQVPMSSTVDFLCFLSRCGGGREADSESAVGLRGPVVASETRFRRWIGGACSCSSMCLSSSASCNEATAHFGALRRRQFAAGLDCYADDLSGRRAANRSSGDSSRLLLFLPAMMPYGRQFSGDDPTSASSSTSWWRSGGEVTIPSGCVPGGGELGLRSKLWSTRTRLLFFTRVQELSCKVFELCCNFIFLMGPFISCTCLKN